MNEKPPYLRGEFDPNSLKSHRPSIRSHQDAEREINGLRDCLTGFAEQAEQLKNRMRRIEADLLRDGPDGTPESVWTAVRRVHSLVDGIERRQKFDLEAGSIDDEEDENVEESAVMRYLREATIRAAVDLPGNAPQDVKSRLRYVQESCQGVLERGAVGGEFQAPGLTRSERAAFQRALAIFRALMG